MNTSFYSDVPKELIGLLRRIRFAWLSPASSAALVSELKAYLTSTGILTPRRVGSGKPTKTADVPQGVPQEVIDLVNSYDYRSIKRWQILIAIPMVESRLRERGLL